MTRIKTLPLVTIAVLAAAQISGCSEATLAQKPAEMRQLNASPSQTTTADTRTKPTQTAAETMHELPERALPDETSNIFFSQGSNTLAPGERLKLKRLAERLRSDQRLSVSLTSYTNDSGSHSFNLAVADRRISIVSTFLKKAGVPVQKIRSSITEDQGLASACRSFECRRTMRRVEFIVINSK